MLGCMYVSGVSCGGGALWSVLASGGGTAVIALDMDLCSD